jgi:uncharacterized membrane protein
MKPLIVLLSVFFITLSVTFFLYDAADYGLSGRIAMAAMLFFTAVGHFIFSNGMSMMIPVFIPFKKELIYGTGILEILGAFGLLFANEEKLTAWLLIIFFILILPSNVFAAMQRLDYEKGTYDGPGPRYLWFRGPLQLFFIGWVWYFGIYLS